MSTSVRVPLDANSTRSEHFRELVGHRVRRSSAERSLRRSRSRSARRATQSGSCSSARSVVGVAVVGISWYKADRDAENEFFNLFAAAHQLNHWPK